MTDRLRNLLGQLTDDQPLVSDWPARVRHTVVVRRQRQRLVAAAAAAVLVVAGTGAAVLANAPAEQDALIGSDQPSPTPSVSAEPSPAPSVQPSTATTLTVTTTPAATTAPTPSAQEPEPEATRTAAPSFPQQGSQDIQITARTTPERPAAGQEWVLEVTVTGFAESEPFLQKPCIEGTMCEHVAHSCAGSPEGQSPPPARPQRMDRTFRHTFPEPGQYEVKLEAESACSYYVGRDKLVLVVEVGQAPPEPTPAPSPSPASASS